MKIKGRVPQDHDLPNRDAMECKFVGVISDDGKSIRLDHGACLCFWAEIHLTDEELIQMCLARGITRLPEKSHNG